MTVTTQATNTLSTTVGATPDKLSDVAGPGTFQLIADLNAMAAGDTVYLSIKLMTRTSGTARYVYDARYDGAQPAKDLIKVSVPVSHSITDATAMVFEINQTAGTTRSIPWTILKFA